MSPINEQIKSALDGRTQRWLSYEVRIPETELSLKMKGHKPFKEQEIKKIEKRLRIKLQY